MTMIIVLTLLPLAAVAGQTDSPGDPTTTAGHMPTLEELYQYLTSGTEPSVPGAFEEPSAGPGATMKTLKELYEDLKALIDQCSATPDNVLDTVTFFSTDPLNWGPQDGTIPTQGAVNGPNGAKTFSIPDGYYSGQTATANDADLVAGNIKNGATIFGVRGTYGPRLKPRFTDNGNGTVTDNHTGLIWLKDAGCLGFRTWDDAQRYIAGLNGGADFSCDSYTPGTYGDWRLPEIWEFTTLVDKRFGTGPVLSNAAGDAQWTEGDAFVAVIMGGYLYWSSSAVVWGTKDSAWLWASEDGAVVGISSVGKSKNGVWPMRDGQ
jgi:hypothetical protein